MTNNKAKALIVSIVLAILMILTTWQVARKYRNSLSSSSASATTLHTLTESPDDIGLSINLSDYQSTSPMTAQLGTNGRGQSITVSKESVRQPHIVFVLADDYGHSDIGYHGSWIKTPVLDR
ncbi:arylsulfatase J, partial [Elysia marginata]